jgi:hypothetical protein
MTVTLARRADIDVDAFRRIAWEGEGLMVDPRALEQAWSRREPFLASSPQTPTASCTA